MNPRDDDWLKAAITDDTMVVDLLVRLRHHSSMPSRHLNVPPAFPLEWTVRQRRSKPVSVTSTSKKQAPTASPTTPLSWSGATSNSGGCRGGGGAATSLEGGLEESSRPSKPSNSTRSKANGDGERSSSSKRSRKKKTLVELKEEENLLVKERRELKRDLASLRLKLEKQRATNDSLKRAKIELQLLNDRGTTIAEGMISVQLQQKKTAFDSIPAMVAPILDSIVSLQCSTLKQKETAAFSPKFLVPDLNIPFEEEHNLEVACEVS
ncbi:hypothetical protein F511_22522 [Dorcoceras hygrometricum]|uniref:Uncharacterized protein n=1 Tax=Dorcoceras hygrometricum TaxID=472368 RepID=A0A2Z7CAW8_9LAMI|nr:hypothetical protein F511_22522 [Dorcoceras hygrometricum]